MNTKFKGTKITIREKTFMLKASGSTLLSDKVFEKGRDQQYEKRDFMIMNGIVHPEDISVQCTK